MPRPTISVPGPLADELIASGDAELVSGRRSSGWQIAAEYATNSATVISLLQGPHTVAAIVRSLRRWRGRQAAEPEPTSKAARVEVVGPGGSLSFSLDDASDKDVDAILRRIFPDLDGPTT